ncbi:glycosyltransferase [Phaeobacter sp. B1627]|uniref:glycosyltransferase n=1 Tax=Phaeobacter sp. B1627 TaxID=2583809 RepID=UPI00111A02DA|nr:glycosyltransferase [Phaeobacter sp. B1627]TNJ39769.1 hypothetical protein FGE21_18570 [Phaeobacter sp. B1627]
MSATFNMVGVIRFSLLTPTFNADRFASLDAAAAALFAPDRMALRLHLFERLCLPSLLRQSDPDFTLVVATSDRMPQKYLQHLADLMAPHANMILCPFGPDKHFTILKQAYALVPPERESHSILFRLDDDDALDGDFISRTKRLAAGLLPLQASAKTPFAISFNRGIYLVKSQTEPARVLDSCERAPLSAGVSLVRPARGRGNPYRFNHRKLAQHYPLYSDISVPAFLRTVHWDNHSAPTMMGLTGQHSESAIDADLIRHFGMTLAELKAI